MHRTTAFTMDKAGPCKWSEVIYAGYHGCMTGCQMGNGGMRIGCSAFLASELGVSTGEDGAAGSLGSGTLLPSLS